MKQNTLYFGHWKYKNNIYPDNETHPEDGDMINGDSQQTMSHLRWSVYKPLLLYSGSKRRTTVSSSGFEGDYRVGHEYTVRWIKPVTKQVFVADSNFYAKRMTRVTTFFYVTSWFECVLMNPVLELC